MFGSQCPFQLRNHPEVNEESPEILHIFDVEELGSYLSQAGFKGFTYTIYGFFILFHAEKG